MSLQTAPRLAWKRERETYKGDDGEKERETYTNTYGAAVGERRRRERWKETNTNRDNTPPSPQKQILTQGER